MATLFHKERAQAAAAVPDHGVSSRDAVAVWARVAAMSFGGPAGQIAVMHRILVEEKRWIGENRFLHALNYCMLLPGPEAQQLAVYIGWLLHRTKGGIVAGTLFIVPGFLSILALSYVYVAFGNITVIGGLFFGLKAAVLAVVLHAVVRIGRRALKNKVMIAVAVTGFVAIFLFHVAFPLVVLAAGTIGFVGGRVGSPLFQIGGGDGQETAAADGEPALGEETPDHARPNWRWSLRVSAVLLALWLGPVALLVIVLGPDDVFSQIAVFFSEMAMVTFGGAYAVLSYVAQQAVLHYGWLRPGEMLDGLGMAETTPGPLIMVVQFVGFMGAYRSPGGLNPMVAATLAAVLTTWVTFLPCFLWIFLGGPFIERLRTNAALTGAMSSITAVVVGVIMNLAIWFALHVLFRETAIWEGYGMKIDAPVWSTINLSSFGLTLAALFAIFGLELPMLVVLLAASLAGIFGVLLGGMG